MTDKNKKNMLTIFFAFLIAITLINISLGIYGAALGTGFFALIIWNNKLRNSTPKK